MNKILLNLGEKMFYFIFLATLTSCGAGDDPNPDPRADFSFDSGQSTPAMVKFINESDNAIAYNWNFGDNSSISNEQSPTHTFPGNGVYQVTLTAIGQTGKFPGKGKSDAHTSSTTKSVTITNGTPALKAVMYGTSYFTFTATNITGTRAGNQIIIRGNNYSNGLTFLEVKIPANTTSGSAYSTKTNSLASLEYNIQSQTTSDHWFSNPTSSCPLHDGTITVSNITPTSITGTFSGKVYRSDCSSTFKISSANFSANL